MEPTGGPSSYFRLQLVPDLLQLYSNMHGRQLVVAANNNWPFFGIRDLPEGGGVTPDSGIDVNILEALSSKLNFT